MASPMAMSLRVGARALTACSARSAPGSLASIGRGPRPLVAAAVPIQRLSQLGGEYHNCRTWLPAKRAIDVNELQLIIASRSSSVWCHSKRKLWLPLVHAFSSHTHPGSCAAGRASVRKLRDVQARDCSARHRKSRSSHSMQATAGPSTGSRCLRQYLRWLRLSPS